MYETQNWYTRRLRLPQVEEWSLRAECSRPGKIFVQLKRAGTPVPDNDLWIAALALEHDLTLITRDRHFERIPQLPRETPALSH